MSCSDRRRGLVESLLLFAAFFLPGYLFQGSSIELERLYDPSYNILFILTGIPQILLMLYLVYLRNESKDHGLALAFASNVPAFIVAIAGIVAVSFPVSLLGGLVGAGNSFMAGSTPDVPMRLLPLVACTCLVTGYREELLFRSMLITGLTQSGLATVPSMLVSSALFSVGHIYQGVLPFIGAFLIGLFLSWHFIRFQSLHAISIAHGIYNFSILMLVSV